MDLGERARALEAVIRDELKGSVLAFAAPGIREAITDMFGLVAIMAHEIEILKLRASDAVTERAELAEAVAGVLRGGRNGT